MSNIVSMVTQFLTPDMIAKIASALGVDRSLVGKALSAAVPGLLGGLTGVAATQEGSRKLFDVVTQQPPGVLDSLVKKIGGSGQSELVDDGTMALNSLLGGSAVSALGGAVGKFAGLGGPAGSSLLAMLAPVVMGVLGKQIAAGGLGASGLSSLLTSQKANIAAALPSGFSGLLAGTGLLNGLGEGVSAAAQPARAATRPARASATGTATPSSGFPRWANWAIPLLIVAGLAWWFLGNRSSGVVEQMTTVAPQATQTVPRAATQSTPGLQNLVVGGVDVGATAQNTVDGLKTTLQGVSDADSAKAALPALQGTTAQLDKLGSLVDQLPASGKAALATFIAAARPSLDEWFGKVLAIPGVSGVAKPMLDKIVAQLDALSKA